MGPLHSNLILAADNAVYLILNCESENEIRGIFSRLATDGTVEQPLTSTLWGAWSGNVTDKFNRPWMLHFSTKHIKRTMKQNNLIYWISTGLIFLMEGVMPALTGNSEMAIEGIRHLGFPDYFRVELTIFKVIGSLALILPMVPVRVKEWAYAGFGIVLISATVGHVVVDGANFQSFMPLIFLVILVVSNVTLHRKLKGS